MDKFRIVKGDMFYSQCEALVIPTSPQPRLEGEIGSQAKTAFAGYLEEQIKQLKKIPMTECVFIPVLNQYRRNGVFMVANPHWHGNSDGNDADQLMESYFNVLALASKYDIKSIAFPILSIGANRFNKRIAIEVALDALSTGAEDYDIDIELFVFHRNIYKNYKDLFDEKKYIIVGEFPPSEKEHNFYPDRERFFWYEKPILSDFEVDSFIKCFVNMVQTSQKHHNEIYDGVVSKEFFSRLMNGKANPDKYTVVSLCINMGASLEETQKLLTFRGEKLNEDFPPDKYIMDEFENKPKIKGVSKIEEMNIELDKMGYGVRLKSVLSKEDTKTKANSKYI